MFSPQCGTGMQRVYAAARIISRTARLPQPSLPIQAKADPVQLSSSIACRVAVRNTSARRDFGCDYLNHGAPPARGHVVNGHVARPARNPAVDRTMAGLAPFRMRSTKYAMRLVGVRSASRSRRQGAAACSAGRPTWHNLPLGGRGARTHPARHVRSHRGRGRRDPCRIRAGGEFRPPSSCAGCSPASPTLRSWRVPGPSPAGSHCLCRCGR